MVSFVLSNLTIQPAFAEGLKVSPSNPRYFEDSNGKIVYLTGSHTWTNLQDQEPSPFDWNGYLNFLTSNNHNFFRLWYWEMTKSLVNGTTQVGPHPYARTGPGNAHDGRLKFDLTQYNQAYFDRMRSRIIDAKDRGMYVSIMLFDGWSLYDKGSNGYDPWLDHPYNPINNVNGVNGGIKAFDTLSNSTVTALQEAYIKKVIDTVNDLDNVLYEICNESDGGTAEMQWQQHMVTYIKNYEATLPNQHPVGITVPWPNGSNSALFSSNADWVSPNGTDYQNNPPASTGAKVIISDTDHLWGIGGNEPWVWESFTRGMNVIYMDPYEESEAPDPVIRRNLGYTKIYADKINLAAMIPSTTISSTTYCLANPGNEYLVYAPYGGTFTVSLGSGTYSVEWFSPSTGLATNGGAIFGGAQQSFTPPFSGDAVLYLDTIPPITSNSGSGSSSGAGAVSVTYTLNTSVVNGHGTITASPSPDPYAQGTVVSLTANPDSGYQVKTWTGTNNDASKDNTNSITMNANRSVTVEFELVANDEENKSGGGGGGCCIYANNQNSALDPLFLLLITMALMRIFRRVNYTD